MGTVHESETSIRWPSQEGSNLSRQFLAVVDGAYEQLEPEGDVEEEHCHLTQLGQKTQ